MMYEEENNVQKTTAIADELVKTIERITIEKTNDPLIDQAMVSACDKMNKFKEEILEITSSEEFNRIFGPIIEFRKSRGYKFSLINTIMIWLQNKNATNVKNASNWREAGNIVIDPRHPIVLIGPYYEEPTPEEIAENPELGKSESELVAEFLAKVGKKSVHDLDMRERETLKVEKNNRGKIMRGRFTAFPYFYDVEQTISASGEPVKATAEEAYIQTYCVLYKGKLQPVRKDKNGYCIIVYGKRIAVTDGNKFFKPNGVVKPNRNDIDIPWHGDENEPESEKSIAIYEAMVELIKSSGVAFVYVDNLGGARGVSKSGKIEVLKNLPRNIGEVSTLIHEFSHEMLHQQYLKKNNKELEKFYIGTNQGRDVVEQQAELSAWIVLRHFGITQTPNINYMGIWGIDKKTAGTVFDTVAGVAGYIADWVTKYIQTNYAVKPQRAQVAESILTESSISGLEVAKLCGCEELYLQSKQMEQQGIESEDNMQMLEENQKAFYDIFNRIR